MHPSPLNFVTSRVCDGVTLCLFLLSIHSVLASPVIALAPSADNPDIVSISVILPLEVILVTLTLERYFSSVVCQSGKEYAVMSGPSLVPADVLVSFADRENAYDILVIRWLFSLVPC